MGVWSSTRTRWPGWLLVGGYAWAVAVAFGATLLDVVNASPAGGSAPAGESEAADVLLALTALAIATGLGALAAAADRPLVRGALLASLGIVVGSLFAPSLLGGFVGEADGAGSWLRLGLAGMASLLAAVGVWASGSPRAGDHG